MAALSLLIASTLSSCGRLESPDVVLSGVDSGRATSDGMEFVLTVEVGNPNDFSADLGDFDYEVRVDERKVGEGSRRDVVTVPAGKTVEVGVPFTLAWKGARDILTSFFDGSDHEWELEGSLEVSKGALRKTFRFTETGTFSALFREDTPGI